MTTSFTDRDVRAHWSSLRRALQRVWSTLSHRGTPHHAGAPHAAPAPEAPWMAEMFSTFGDAFRPFVEPSGHPEHASLVSPGRGLRAI